MEVSIRALLDNLEDSSVALEETGAVSARRVKAMASGKLRTEAAARPLSRRMVTPARAAALVLAFSITACALVGGRRLFVSTGARLSSPALADTAEAEEAFGFRIIAPETFSNGCRFVSMTLSGMDVLEEGGEAESYSSVSIAYAAPDSLSFTMGLYPAWVFERGYLYAPEPLERRSYAGHEIRLNRDCHRFVPYDHELTEEERAREAAGHFVVIRDRETDKAWEQTAESALFELEGVVYILQADALPGAERSTDLLDTLAEMAQEVIDAGRGSS